jgi:HEAT repeat protein
MPSGLLLAQDPATRPLVTVADQSAVLKAPNATQAERNEAARRLVADRSPQGRQALHDALVDLGSRAGQLAVARALATDLTGDAQFVDELFALAASEPPTNEAAIAALASTRSADVRARMIDLARDPNHQQRDSTRVAAIAAVGGYSDKASAKALMDLLVSDAENTEIHAAAGDALAQMTGVRGNGHDPAKWEQWWTANAQKPDDAFENDLLADRAARFVRWQHRHDRLVEEMQSVLSSAYQTAPEKSREALLLRYLKSDAPEMRVAGVRIVIAEYSETRAPVPAVRAQLRLMLGDSSTHVRIQVAQTLRALNDPTALDALAEQLRREPDVEVRATLVEALAATEDVKVVPELIAILNDPSIAVAETAAKGLAKMGPAVRTANPELAKKIADAVQDTLQKRTSGPGTAAFRAALIDALAPLRFVDLRMTFTRMLQPNEAVPVRRSAARALGELQQSWAADTLVNSLDDPDQSVRIAVLDALKQCATFEHAEAIYLRLKSDSEPAIVKQKAWDALSTVFPKADTNQLDRWADRFMNEHPRRYQILQQEADQLRKQNAVNELSGVQQNIGVELMAMGDPAQAATYFEKALQFHESRNAPAAVADLSSLYMEALLASGQYQKACEFAAGRISNNQGNQMTMGPKLRNQVDELRKKRKFEEALTLIDAIKKMNPQLAQQFLSPIGSFEEEIRKVYPEKGKTLAPRSENAVGAAAVNQR